VHSIEDPGDLADTIAAQASTQAGGQASKSWKKWFAD